MVCYDLVAAAMTVTLGRLDEEACFEGRSFWPGTSERDICDRRRMRKREGKEAVADVERIPKHQNKERGAWTRISLVLIWCHKILRKNGTNVPRDSYDIFSPENLHK